MSNDHPNRAARPRAQPRYETFAGTKVFGSLDGLRCLSILAVIWHHTASDSFPDLPLAGRGHHGVTLFFAISGFLITTLLLRERHKTGDISLRKFYTRRSLRIFPLYYAVLGIYVALVFAMERDTRAGAEFFDNLPAYATYTSNWFVDLSGPHVIFYFAWSLATEEQFYLVWPWIERYTRPRTAMIVMSAILIVTQLARYGVLGLEPGLLLTVLESVMPGICLGAILAHLLHHPRTYRAVAAVIGYRWSAVVFLGALVGYLALPSIDDVAVHLLGVLVVGSMVCREDHVLARPLSFAPIRYMGSISYGMYMLHMLSKNAWDRIADRIGIDRVAELVHVDSTVFQVVGTTLIAVLAATISFRYYESFFLRLKHRFSA